MRPSSLQSTLLHYFLCLVIAVGAILTPLESYAQYDGPRKSDYKSNSGMCDTSGGNKYIAFDPYGENVDYEFDMMGNPFCRDIAIGVGSAAVAASLAASAACRIAQTCELNTPAAQAEEKEEAFIGPLLPTPGPSWPLKIALKVRACSSRTAVNTFCCASVDDVTKCGRGTYDTLTCCSAVASFLTAVTAVMSALAFQYGEAHQAYDNARICGHNWYTWRQLDSEGAESADGIWTKTKGKYQNCLRNLFLGEENTFVIDGCNGKSKEADIKNKYYREYIYGGIEYEDTNGCANPKTWDKSRRTDILGYASDPQRYYMTGPGSASSFACRRFLATPKSTEKYTQDQDYAAMQKAYECCVKRSQNSICIENKGGSKDVNNVVTGETNYEHKFCEIGDISCHVGSVDFEVYESTSAVNYVCAKTYSACPYNHLLGGGTEKADRDSDGNTKNYCQYLNHCSKRPLIPYVRTSSLQSAYIDSSCKNLKGDTQNTFSYESELLSISAKGFTAPIVQCVKETMQNMFLNKAGFTECTEPDEVPDQNGQCVSGETFKKGKELTNQKSFFEKLRDRFQLLIRIVLTFSVVMFGAMLLFASPNTKVERKKLLPYVLKIALVVYFTLGDAWQGVFVEGVLNASGYLATITFKPDDPSLGTSRLDGCQFPRFNYRETEESIERYYPVNSQNQRDDSLLSYPPGKEYLQIWDALDCKIALALGLGVEATIPNLVMMILGGFLTAGFGIVFVVISFSFAFFIIFLSIRAMQFFLVAMLSVVLLIYFSTFIIPLSLFERTKSIFGSWWKNLLSFTLQPMILFAYLGVLIAIFDNVVMGSATFSPATVTIDGVSKVDDYGRISPKTISCNDSAKNDSVYCIFKIADIKTYNGLEALGIGLPMLASVNGEKLMTLAKAALIMFVFSKFMDKINTLASELTGGTTISTGWENSASPSKMAQEMYSKLRGAQQRGMRGSKKAVRAGVDAAKGSKESKKEGSSDKSESADGVGKKGKDPKGSDDGAGKKGGNDPKGNDDGAGKKGGNDPKGNDDGAGNKGNDSNTSEDGAKSPSTGNTEGDKKDPDGSAEGKGSGTTPSANEGKGGKGGEGGKGGKGGEGGKGGKGGEGDDENGDEGGEDDDKNEEGDDKEGQERPDGEKDDGEKDDGEKDKSEKGEETAKEGGGSAGGKEESSAGSSSASTSSPEGSAGSGSASAASGGGSGDSTAGSSSGDSAAGSSATAGASSSGGGAGASSAAASSSGSGGAGASSAAASSSGGAGSTSSASSKNSASSASSGKSNSESSSSAASSPTSTSPETAAQGPAENPEGTKNDQQQPSDTSSSPEKTEETKGEAPSAPPATPPAPPAEAPATTGGNEQKTPSNENSAAPEQPAGDAEAPNSDPQTSENDSDQSDNSPSDSNENENNDQDSSSGEDLSAQEQNDTDLPPPPTEAQLNQQSATTPPPPPQAPAAAPPPAAAKKSSVKKKSSVNHPMPNREQKSRVGQSTVATEAHKKAGAEIRKSTVKTTRPKKPR